MSTVAFVGDLHLGHKRILEFAANTPGAFRGGADVDEHDEWVIQQCLSIHPNKRTVWYLLGDLAMDADRLHLLNRIPGRKILVGGNHDEFNARVYLDYVDNVVGMVNWRKYKFWITHAPMHPAELRGKPNIHGHCHRNDEPLRSDPRYLLTSIEWLPNNRPITLDEVRETWLPAAQDACA